MAIVITPREDQAPIRGELIESPGAFQPPATIERTARHEAIKQETHGDAVQLLAAGWKQDLANQINVRLAASATHHLLTMSVEIERDLAANSPSSDGMVKIIAPAISAIVQQIAAHVQVSTVVSAQNVSELATKVPTGDAFIKRWEKEEKQERKREEREQEREREEERLRYQERNRPPSLLEMIFGRK